MERTNNILNAPAIHSERLLEKLNYGWTPFADEITKVMLDAVAEIKYLKNRDTKHREMARLQLARLQKEINELKNATGTKRNLGG